MKSGISPGQRSGAATTGAIDLGRASARASPDRRALSRRRDARHAPFTDRAKIRSAARSIQTVLPDAATAQMLFRALLASVMRKVGGWETLPRTIDPETLDLAARGGLAQPARSPPLGIPRRERMTRLFESPRNMYFKLA